MIEIVVLFLAVYGTIGVPIAPNVNRDSRNLGNEAIDDSEIVEAQLPGAENLNEKALPISRLYAAIDNIGNLPGNENLKEKSQLRRTQEYDYTMTIGGTDATEEEGNTKAMTNVRRPLPGIKNLAEKAIPEDVIQRMSKKFGVASNSYSDLERNPL